MPDLVGLCEDCSESEGEDNHSEVEDKGSESEVDGEGDENLLKVVMMA